MKLAKYIFIFSFFYFLILTIGVPFFWQDHLLIAWFSEQSFYHSLGMGMENAFRPLENLTYIGFVEFFGHNPLPFRILKALFAAGVVLWIYYFVKKATKNNKISILALIFYLTSAAVFESVLLIYDFEIVAQFLLLCAAFYFFKAYEKDRFFSKEILFFILLPYLAILIKESAKMFVFIIITFITLTNWRKWKYLLTPTIILTILSFKPWILWPNVPAKSMSIIGDFTFHRIILLIKYVFVSNFFITGIFLFLLFRWFFRFRSINRMPEFIESKKYLFFFSLWFCLTSFLILFIGVLERRYVCIFLLLFTLIFFIFLGINHKQHMNKWLTKLFIILILLNIMLNLGESVKYRYTFGNFVDALDEANSFLMQNYKNSFIKYPFHSNFLLEYTEKNNNSILPSKEPITEEILNQNKDIVLLDANNEKGIARFIKNVIKGPYCLPLYKLESESIKQIDLQRKKDKVNQILSYTFRKVIPISYCDIQLETKFLFPQKIEITLSTKEDSLKKIIKAPLGRHTICTYHCNASINESNKVNIQKIEIKTRNSFFNKLYSGSINIRK